MSADKIAYYGEPGSNSHIASTTLYPTWKQLGCGTFKDAFAAVSDGAAAMAMIPIENSIAGRVADTYDLLPTAGRHSVGEYFMAIRFQLLGIRWASLAALKTVYS